MNCGWCGANADGTDSHGICGACMVKYFGVDPASLVHTETDQEQEKEQVAA